MKKYHLIKGVFGGSDVYDENGNQCACVKKIINTLLKEHCGMPLQNITFEDCDAVDEKIVDVLKNICKTYPTSKKYTNVLLSGESGTGKTYLTMAMAVSWWKAAKN